MMMRMLFERLETSPGQEKAIKSAVEQVFESMRAARHEWSDASELAVLLTGETFDATAAEGISGKADASFARVRVSIVESMRQIHEALDERQRKLLADWLRDLGHRSARWS